MSILLCLVGFAGTLFILDLKGIAPSIGSLRGARRLQMTTGSNVVYQAGAAGAEGAQYAHSEVAGLAADGGQMANQGAEYGGQVAGHVGSVANQGYEYGHNLAHQGYQYGSNVVDTVRGAHPYANEALEWSPEKLLNKMIPTPVRVLLPLMQVIFAVIYYCTVVSNYPYWNGPTPMSCELQSEAAPCATTRTSPSNCALSYCCPQARAAHTFDRTGTLDYWCGLIAMFFCPFCTLCFTNACTDLNPKLGGQDANPVASALCTWCCACCVIAQDAESLDAATGVRTECCGVSGGMGPFGPMGYGGQFGGPYGGPPMYPGQMMMQPQW
jgi:hypothetical protein